MVPSLFRLILAVLGFYLLLRVIGWVARRLLVGPRNDLRRQRKGKHDANESAGPSIREEDIQDARYKEIDPES